MKYFSILNKDVHPVYVPICNPNIQDDFLDIEIFAYLKNIHLHVPVRRVQYKFIGWILIFLKVFVESKTSFNIICTVL